MAVKNMKPDLLYVMQQSGVDFSHARGQGSLMLRCPFHEDRGRPNLAVWPTTGRWRCFRCDVGGDVYDFVGLLLYGEAWNSRDKQMFKEVLRRLNVDRVPQREVQALPQMRAMDPLLIQMLELASRVYHLALLGSSGQPFRALLAERGISAQAVRRYRIGYGAPGALLAVMAAFPPDRQRVAQAAGLFHDEREWLQGRIVFPDVGRNGTVLHMIGRAPERDARLRYLSLPGLPKTIWGLDNLRRSQPAILTESIIDALNLRELGYQGLAVNGTGLALPLAEKLRRVPFLAILPQNDAAGRDAVEKWRELLPRARVLAEIPWGQKADGAPQKDFNDLWLAEGQEKAAQVLLRAMQSVGLAPSPHLQAG